MKIKTSKYKSIRTEVDGILFDSKREANRYKELRLLEKAGEIKNLELQKRYDFEINGVKLGFYKADFVYREKVYEDYHGLTTSQLFARVEDCKGFKTPVYRLKKKLMKAIHGIDILET